MGDPRRIGKKYNPPNHPWIKSRIDEFKALRKEFGLKNQKEILKMESVLKNFSTQAKKLAIATGNQAALEKQQLLQRMQKLGLLQSGGTLADVLGVTTRSVLERRLQTIIVKQGLARTPKQARQFIVHRHIYVNGKAMTAPSYLVTVSEEATITFNPKSDLADAEHPERSLKQEEKKVPTHKEEPEKKEEVKEEKAEEAKDDKKEEKAEAKEEKEEVKEEKKEEAPEEKAEPAKEEKAEQPEEKKEESKEEKKEESAEKKGEGS